MSSLPLSSYRDKPFALITAISKDAAAALTSRTSSMCLNNGGQYSDIKQGAKDNVVAELNFSSILGRRVVSFGSNSRSQCRLPGADVSMFHFLIHFDVDNGDLVVSDVSQTGTWIDDTYNGGLKLLHRASHIISGDVGIFVGHEQRLKFNIQKTALTTTDEFRLLFREYRASIRRTLERLRTKNGAASRKRRASEDLAAMPSKKPRLQCKPS